MRKLILGILPVALTGAFLLGGTGTVFAQRTGGTGGGLGGSTGGGLGGSTGGGLGGSTGGGLGGSTGIGGSTGGSTGSATRTGSGTSTSNYQYGTGSPLSGYYYSPMAYGLNGNTEPTSSGVTNGNSSINSSVGGGGTSSRGGSSSSSSSSSGFSNIQASPVAKFGQALYNVQPQSTFTQPTSQGGTATVRQNTTQQQMPQTSGRPAYSVRVGFTPPATPVSQVVLDFQNAVAASTDLSKPNNQVQLVVDGNVVVLRGVVQDERERALAETLATLTPGVRGVRNELAVREATPGGLASR